MKGFLGTICSTLLFLVVMYAAVAHQVKSTLFNAEFVNAEIDQADPVRAVRAMLVEHLPPDVGSALAPVIDATLEEQRPWLVDQVRQAASAFQEYLRGDTGRIQVVIDPQPLRQSFLNNIVATLRKNPRSLGTRNPADQQAFEATARQAVNDAFDRIETFRFDSEALSPAAQGQLFNAGRGLRFFERPLGIVVGVGVVLLVLTALVGQLRPAALAVLVAGVLLFLPSLFASTVVKQLPIPSVADMPIVLAAYLPTLSEHLMAPLQTVALGCLCAGLALFALSFAMPTRRRGRSSGSRSRHR